MDQPIVDPPIPYTGVISGGFTPGKMVRIQGYVSPVGERFNINFQTGPNFRPRDDVALHISVRLLEGYIARNSLEKGSWGEEQDSGTLPISTGQKFEIIVLVETSQYKIAINGKHFTEFPHRIPINQVNHLLIDGDISLSLISWEGGDGNAPSAPTQASQQHSGAPPTAPYGPPQGQYGGPPQGQYGGPPPGQYGGPPPGQYGGPPFGQYGGPPPGQYGGPPPQYGAYGPSPQAGPYGNAGYPHPPGYTEPSGYENFLDTAQTAIAGAISSGAAEKLLGGLFGGGQSQNPSAHPPAPQQPPMQPTTQQQHNPFDMSHISGQGSLGGLGSVGSLLQSFAGQVFSGQQQHKPVRMPMPTAAPPASMPIPPALHGASPSAMPMPQLPNPISNHPYPANISNAGFTNPSPYPNQYPTPGEIPVLPGYPSSNPYIMPGPPGAPSGYPSSPYHMSGPAPPVPLGYGNHPSSTSPLPFIPGKKMSKSKLKKAMKYGLPIAGAGVGAYALSKAFHHHHSSSSSSSSSDSD